MTRKSPVEQRTSRTVVRLTLQFGALIFVTLALVGVLAYSIVRASTDESNARSLQDAVRVDSPRDAPNGTVVILPDGQHQQPAGEPMSELPAGLPDQAAWDRVERTGQDEFTQLTAGDDTYVVLTTERDGHIRQAALNTHETVEEMQRLRDALLISGLLATVAGGIISFLMARRAVTPLSEALAIQQRFIADASHELRTPLTLLSTRAQLLRRRTDSTDPVSDGLDELIEDANQLTTILEDLLLAADPREDSSSEQVDLGHVADATVTRFSDFAATRDITLSVNRPAANLIVGAREAALERVVTALLENALDHAQSVVTVHVRRERLRTILEVTDDGPGLPEGSDGTLFTRFASNRSTSAGTTHHYGLGLALVSEIAHRFNGGVFAHNATTGHGATIGVWFPVPRRPSAGD